MEIYSRSEETLITLFFTDRQQATNLSPLTDDLDLVFNANATGFRELLATILYGKYLNPEYSPRADLYECNPRSLYEKGIKPLFDKRGIPSGQSGPLNVAKATSSLNEQWAAQRRPADVADAVVRLGDWINTQTESEILALGEELGKRFDRLAKIAVETQISLTADTSSITLVNACTNLITKHPLKGIIPQAICGIALETEFLASELFYVDGTRDSASTTNKTSKKVGDLTVNTFGNELVRVYEVTVKEFSDQRVREAVQSVEAFYAPGKIPENFVDIVLCRPEDLPEVAKESRSKSLLGEHEQGGVIFEFIDLFEWLATKIAEFSINQRRYFFETIQEFLNGVRIPAEVRASWADYLN